MHNFNNVEPRTREERVINSSYPPPGCLERQGQDRAVAAERQDRKLPQIRG